MEITNKSRLDGRIYIKDRRLKKGEERVTDLMTNSKIQMTNQCQSANDKIQNLTLDIEVSIDL